MATLQRNVTITPEDYLKGEEYSTVKHEYVDGTVHAMVGVSRAHNLLAGNLYRALARQLGDGPCLPFMADVKVKAGRAFYYPDVMVDCTPDADLDAHYCEAPVLLAEVLSASTEQRDRNEKRYAYQSLPSLREYLLIAQDRIMVEVYRRSAEGWDLEILDTADTLRLDSVGLTLPVAALYRGIRR